MTLRIKFLGNENGSDWLIERCVTRPVINWYLGAYSDIRRNVCKCMYVIGWYFNSKVIMTRCLFVNVYIYICLILKTIPGQYTRGQVGTM